MGGLELVVCVGFCLVRMYETVGADAGLEVGWDEVG